MIRLKSDIPTVKVEGALQAGDILISAIPADADVAISTTFATSNTDTQATALFEMPFAVREFHITSHLLF